MVAYADDEDAMIRKKDKRRGERIRGDKAKYN